MTVDAAAPRLAPGSEQRRTARGVVLAAPGGRGYCELDARAMPVVAALDGATSAAELRRRFGDEAAALVEELRDDGYLADSPPEPPRAAVVLTPSGVEFAGAAPLVGALHHLARPLLNPAGLLVLLALAAVGLGAPAVGLLEPLAVRGAAGAATAAVTLLLLQGVLVVVHELAHAVVLAHYGRRVGRVGVGLYWGGLSFYVDASAALMLETRGRRVLQAGAGLLVDAALAGVLVLLARYAEEPATVALLSQAAVVACIGVLLNATPLLQLDGYWVLADLLDEPALHRRAMAALVRVAGGARERRDLALACYAAAGLLFGLVLLAGAAVMWTDVVGVLVSELWDGSPWERVLAGVLALPLAALALQLLAFAAGLLARRPTTAPSGEVEATAASGGEGVER